MAQTEKHTLPAIPPEDYTGTQAMWLVKLQERGFWNGEGFHGDILIPIEDYMEILNECENN